MTRTARAAARIAHHASAATTAGTAAPQRRRLGAARRGFTAVESLICVCTLLVGLGAALPGFNSARDRHRVEGAAAQLETDLQLTRSLAVAQNRTIRFEVARSDQGSCYIVHSGSAGDCTCSPTGTVCTPGVEAHRSVHFGADSGVAVAANVRSMVFEPTRGTVTPTGTLRIEGAQVSVRQVVNIMGRVRTCTPSAGMPGLKAC